MVAEICISPARALWLLALWMLTSVAIGAEQQRAEAQARGRELYLSGVHASGRPLQAHNDGTGLPLPPAFVACVNCHGHEARGTREAGTVSSDIRWSELSKPYELTRSDGRRRAPYDAATFFAALTQGRDPSGHALDTAMPRFALSARDAADLRAYLEHLASPEDQGISSDTIHIGVTASVDAPNAESDRQLLACWFDAINRKGGIFRRHVELIDIAGRSSQIKPPILALLAIGADDSRAPAVDAPPGIALLSAVADAPEKADRYRFALYPGSEGRARVLVRYAIAHEPSSPLRLALLYSETSSARLAAVNAALKPLMPLKSIPIPSANANALADKLVDSLRADGINTVVMLGSDADTEALTASALRREWDPLLLWIEPPANAAKGSRALTVAPARINDVSAEAGASYARCVDLANTSERDRARQLALLATARLLVSALEQSGRDISRERLVETLHSLREFRSGFAPAGSLTAQRHTAASGVYVVPLSASRIQPDPVWMSLN
jgi:mono/diheme cytochrome c family protein